MYISCCLCIIFRVGYAKIGRRRKPSSHFESYINRYVLRPPISNTPRYLILEWPLVKVKVTYISSLNVQNRLKIRMGPFANSFHFLDIVHFEDLRVPFDRADPYLYSDILMFGM